MKKAAITQDLVNVFPPWSRVRSDDQSVGYRLLNGFAIPMEDMNKQLIRMGKNIYLDTANLDEIDITYRVDLGSSFSFDEDSGDPAITRYQVPVVTGTISGQDYNISLAPGNTVRDFWYDSNPTRISLSSTVTGVNHNLYSFESSGYSQSGVWSHHLEGGDVFLEASGGDQYITLADDNTIVRAGVLIHGTTRKGTEETETVIVPWDMRQKLQKEWSEITKIELKDMPSGITLSLKSADFNQTDYLDFYNLSHSENRRKVDTFWGLGTVSGKATLDRINYVNDEWEQLMLGITDKEVSYSWELTYSGVNVSGVDLALTPFQDKAWVATASGLLHLYNLEEELVSSYEFLDGATPAASIKIDMDQKFYILGEDISFIPWHARPILPIKKYRVWVIDPSGNKSVFIGTTLSTWSSTHWEILNNEELVRDIAAVHSFTPSERGEYKVCFEVVLSDDTIENYRMVAVVENKEPLVTFDISSYIDGVVNGVDFDADQQLCLSTTSGYYQFDLHKDIMLIDYSNKYLYLHEQYDSLEVTTSG